MVCPPSLGHTTARADAQDACQLPVTSLLKQEPFSELTGFLDSKLSGLLGGLAQNQFSQELGVYGQNPEAGELRTRQRAEPQNDEEGMAGSGPNQVTQSRWQQSL